MKKYLILIASLMLLSGCSDSDTIKVVCKKGDETSSVTLTANIVDKKQSGKIKAELFFASEDEAQSVCEAEEEYVESLSDKTKYKVTCKAHDIIIDDYSFVLTNQGVDVVGKTKTQFVKAMEEYNFSCS